MDCQIHQGICQTHADDTQVCPFHNPGSVTAEEVRTNEPDALFASQPDDQDVLVDTVAKVKAAVEAVPTPPAPYPTLQVIGALPGKAYSTDAGFDLPASQITYLSAHEVRPVPTGIKVKIPKGYFGRIVPRSSAARRGIEVIDGTIDAGYTGELFVMAKATSDLYGELMVPPGQRIGQLLLFPVLDFIVEGVESFTLEEGERGEAGFGSSGL